METFSASQGVRGKGDVALAEILQDTEFLSKRQRSQSPAQLAFTFLNLAQVNTHDWSQGI
jgi:hypothetical protein